MITAVLVLVFGGLTLYLHDKTFIKMKPTIIYAIFALVLAGGALTGRNFIKLLFDHVFHLPEDCWRTLTWRWVAFFLVMAVLNEIVWRNFSDEFWAGFKLFGAIAADLHVRARAIALHSETSDRGEAGGGATAAGVWPQLSAAAWRAPGRVAEGRKAFQMRGFHANVPAPI